MDEISVQAADVLAAYQAGGGNIPYEKVYQRGEIETEIRVPVWELKNFLKTAKAFSNESTGEGRAFRFSVKNNGSALWLSCDSRFSAEPYSVCVQASAKGKAQRDIALDADLLSPFLENAETEEILIQIHARYSAIDFHSGENYRFVLVRRAAPCPWARIRQLEARVKELKKRR